MPQTTSTHQRAIAWQLKTRSLNFTRIPAVMGIVNVTPDSFSDGGAYFDPQHAVDHALRLARDGASILDIGGESTRPYSEQVTEQEELRRVVDVVRQVCQQTDVPVSIDTSKATVARAAIEAGAEIINDVTGLEKDPEMINVALETGAGICAMHMQGTPQTMQDNPVYENVVDDIYRYLADRKTWLLSRGIEEAKVCLDPGIGFGKTHQHNLELLQHCQRFLELCSPILVGHSRKGFIGKILEDKTADRTAATLGISIALMQKGIQILRVHDVRETCDGLRGFTAASTN